MWYYNDYYYCLVLLHIRLQFGSSRCRNSLSLGTTMADYVSPKRVRVDIFIPLPPRRLVCSLVRWRDTKTPMKSLLLPACRLAAYYYCLFFHCYCSTTTDIVTAADAAIGKNCFGFGVSNVSILYNMLLLK